MKTPDAIANDIPIALYTGGRVAVSALDVDVLLLVVFVSRMYILLAAQSACPTWSMAIMRKCDDYGRACSNADRIHSNESQD